MQSKALAFNELFTAGPAEAMISNLRTVCGLREVGPLLLPVTINSNPEPTCYPCCPSVAYIDYARDELRHFSDFRLLSGALDALLRLGYPLIRLARLDRQVQLNNWLLATNPIPDVTSDALRAVTEQVVRDKPGHVVVWRSLNDYGDRDAIEMFRQAGYRMYPARQIYLFDCREREPKIHRDERRDMALLESGEFKLGHAGRLFRGEDFARAQVLYQHLYLDKYTWLNPQYTAHFMQTMLAKGILDFRGLRADDGQLAGVIAFFDQDRTMTAPIVGYDATLPQEKGLYRMLMALASQRARERKLLYNMSAGAAGFKRNRGGVAAIEYAAVYEPGICHGAIAWRRASDPQRSPTGWVCRSCGRAQALNPAGLLTAGSRLRGVGSSLRTKPLRVLVDGHALVLFRACGGLHCLTDRCPHRSAPLSGGKVLGSAIDALIMAGVSRRPARAAPCQGSVGVPRALVPAHAVRREGRVDPRLARRAAGRALYRRARRPRRRDAVIVENRRKVVAGRSGRKHPRHHPHAFHP